MTSRHGQSVIVYQAGNLWTGVRATSTDKMMVEALSAHTPVLWIDPPAPPAAMQRQEEMEGRPAAFGLDEVAPQVLRLRTRALRGFSRPGIRTAAKLLHRRRVRRVLRDLGVSVRGVVLANSMQTFPPVGRGATRVLFLTDDWVAGAGLLGMNADYIKTGVAAATRSADIVLGVSPALLESVTEWAGPHTALVPLPSGCTVTPAADLGPRPADLPAGPFAVLAGSINERTDLDQLQLLAEHDVTVVVIGARIDRDADFVTRFEELARHPNVTYLGRREQSELPAYLAAAHVGLTPYTDTEFNRSSFPLKTLDYLSAGTPVVSTDLPASRWFDTDLVQVAADPDQFTALVLGALAASKTDETARRCRDFALLHTWEQRAQRFFAILDSGRAAKASRRQRESQLSVRA